MADVRIPCPDCGVGTMLLRPHECKLEDVLRENAARSARRRWREAFWTGVACGTLACLAALALAVNLLGLT